MHDDASPHGTSCSQKLLTTLRDTPGKQHSDQSPERTAMGELRPDAVPTEQPRRTAIGRPKSAPTKPPRGPHAKPFSHA